MHAAFGLQIPVSHFAFHQQSNALKASFLTRQIIEHFHIKAHALAVAYIHAHEHGRPILRVNTTRAGVEF